MPAARDIDAREEARYESASAKLWGVYVSEAEKYDRALVESWRSDMDGMLIFTGLFSASLTAFIVESYKTLLPDSGDSTVVLLTQISLQLAASANGTTFVIPAPIPFTPPTAYVVCNALWFISLGFSLTCALIATLLEQWARDYLHKTNMHSAPVVRARIFAYLFYGLKRFKLHVVVELVPLLLHSSLVFFFAGLVAFLLPVNTVLVAITSCVLGLTLVIYSFLTVLPILWPDCPYRTPLSSGLLSLWQNVVVVTQHIYRNAPKNSARTALSARWRTSDLIAQRATQPSQERNLRDRRALTWTCRYLSDDASIEAFLEGIPYVLHGPRSDQNAYSDHVLEMVHLPNVSIASHIAGLLSSCESGVLTNHVTKRRQLICLKTTWAIALMSTPQKPLLHQLFSTIPSTRSYLAHYAVSAGALLGRSILHFMNDDILKTVTLISRCQKDVQAGKQPDLSPALRATNYILREGKRLGLAGKLIMMPPDGPASVWLQDAAEAVELIGWGVFSDYLHRAARLDALPYEYYSTASAFDFGPAMASPHITFSSHINATFNTICADHLDVLSGQTETQHVDEILATVGELWRMARAERTVVPRAMLEYLSCRTSTDAVRDLVRAFDVNRAWRGILNYKHNKDFATKPPKDFAEAFWRIIAVGFSRVEPDSLEEALLVLHSLPDFAAKHSAVSLVHATLLSRLFDTVTVTRTQWNYALRPPTLTELATMLAHPALPADNESLFPVPTPIRIGGPGLTATSLLKECVAGKVKEGYIHLLGDYFHSCGSSTTPYKALETLACIRSVNYSRSISQNHHRVHPAHQTRFSEGLQAMFRGCKDPALLEETLSLSLFSPSITVIPPAPDSLSEQPLRYLHWLDDPSARRTVEDTLFSFRPPPSASPTLSETWSKIGWMLQESADAGSSISSSDLEALLSFAPQRGDGTG